MTKNTYVIIVGLGLLFATLFTFAAPFNNIEWRFDYSLTENLVHYKFLLKKPLTRLHLTISQFLWQRFRISGVTHGHENAYLDTLFLERLFVQ